MSLPSKPAVIRLVWGTALLLGLIAEYSSLLPKAAHIVLPAIYLSLSFVVFDRFILGYRIFHLMCVVSIWLYFALGLLLQLPDILSSSGIRERMAYIWFESLSTTYLVFLMMFGVAYLPYLIYQRMNARTTDAERTN